MRYTVNYEAEKKSANSPPGTHMHDPPYSKGFDPMQGPSRFATALSRTKNAF